MAELHIERKKNVWPWVIALIVVLVLIGAALLWIDGDRAGASLAPPADPTADASVAAMDDRTDPRSDSATDADETPARP